MDRLLKLFDRFQAQFQSDEALIEKLPGQSHKRALRTLDELKERECIKDGTLRGASLVNARLSEATFARGNLAGVDFSGATLTTCYFYDAVLEEAVFDRADLTGANFRAARLQRTSFVEATLKKANFARADLAGATLQQTDLSGANFWQTTLTGVNFEGATLDGVNLTDVICDDSTILPDGSTWHEGVNWSQWTEAD